MITLSMFILMWELCGGKFDVIENFTEQQKAIAFLIIVASELNIVWTTFLKTQKGPEE